MKKTLIALAVAGTAVATGANASEIYNQDGTSLALGGRVEARLSGVDGNVSDYSRVRINLLGKTEITDSLYGLGFYEAEYTTNDESQTATKQDTIDTRYIYAGIGGDFGLVSYGKQDGALVAVTNFTDIMDAHGGVAAQENASAGDHIDNMLAYTGTFGDFSVNATYRFADRAESTVKTDTTSYDDTGLEGYALTGIYNISDTGIALGLGLADQNSKLDNAATAYNSTRGAMQYLAGASWTYNDLYLSALYSAKDYDNTSVSYQGYELAAKYTLDKTVLIATYGQGHNDNDTAKANDLGLEVAYNFKPNFKAYIDYDFNFLNGNEADVAADPTKGSEDEAMLGLRYDF